MSSCYPTPQQLAVQVARLARQGMQGREEAAGMRPTDHQPHKQTHHCRMYIHLCARPDPISGVLVITDADTREVRFS